MKTVAQLTADGLKILACSTNGAFEVPSYIATRRGKRVYGYWDYRLARYVEQRVKKP